jgi:prepilin-type N-terminal cleavage/methylation domain-containing protein
MISDSTDHTLGADGCPPRRRSTAFTLIELLVVISILALLAGLLMPAVQAVRDSSRRTQCHDHLHNLVLGLHGYEAAHRVLPPGSLAMGNSFDMQHGWGWGALMLPNIEQSPLHRQLNFEQGSAVGDNARWLATPLEIWSCPSSLAPELVDVLDSGHAPLQLATGNYCGVEGVLSAMSTTRLRDITDGLSQTLFIGETRFQAGALGLPSFTSAWCGKIAYSDDYAPHAIPHLGASSLTRINLGTNFAGAFGSQHPGGANLALGDGRAMFFSENLSTSVFKALGTPDGGESVSP